MAFPKLPEVFLHGPSATGFQIRALVFLELGHPPFWQVLGVEKEKISAPLEAFVAFSLQEFIFLSADLIHCLVEVFGNMETVVNHFDTRCYRPSHGSKDAAHIQAYRLDFLKNIFGHDFLIQSQQPLGRRHAPACLQHLDRKRLEGQSEATMLIRPRLLTPCSGQLALGMRANRIVSKPIESKCLHFLFGERSCRFMLAPHSGQIAPRSSPMPSATPSACLPVANPPLKPSNLR